MPRPPGPSVFFAIPAARRMLADPRALITDGALRYGRVFRTRIPDRGRLCDLVWLLGTDANERVLAPAHRDDFSWYEGYRFTMESIFGRDILLLRDDTVEKQEHRDRYRKLIPAFHPRTDAAYLGVIRALTERHLAGYTDGAVVDLGATIKRLTFEVVARLLLGARDQDMDRLFHLFEAMGLGLYSVFRLDVPGFRYRTGLLARRALAEFLSLRIAEFRAELRSSGELPDHMLGTLMQSHDEAGEPLPDETLIGEMLSFLFAGYDTTCSLLTSFFVALGKRPELATRIADEARALPEFTHAALHGQPLLDAALVEAERLFPPLTFCMRGVRRDFSFGGYDIAAGSKVAYSAYYSGRQAEHFDAPDEFRPERFLDGKKVPPYTLVGFGAGHRACIGKRFASLELRAFVSLLYAHADVEPLPAQSDEVYFNPAPQRRHGFRARIHLRK